jgi:hypothetical protein
MAEFVVLLKDANIAFFLENLSIEPTDTSVMSSEGLSGIFTSKMI